MASTTKISAIGFLFALFLAIFINYPAPEFSQKVKGWEKKGKYFLFNNYKIFYRDDTGQGKHDDVLLLVHGFPTSSYDWHKVWRKLTKRFKRVIAPDMLGFGFSEKPVGHNYTVGEQASLHEQLLGHLGVTDVHILAHDLGDTVAQEILSRVEINLSKLKIRSLCLTNGGIFPETHFPRPMQKLLLIEPLAPVLTRLSCFLLFRFSFSAVFGPQTQPTNEELWDFWSLIRHNNGQLVFPRVLKYMEERRQFRERWVGVISVTFTPVHFIYGPSDPVNPPAILERLKQVAPTVGISELPQHIGHYPQVEDPKGLIAAYSKFIKHVREIQEVDQ